MKNIKRYDSMTTIINHQKIAKDFKAIRFRRDLSIQKVIDAINKNHNISIAKSTVLKFEKGNGMKEFQLLKFLDFAGLDLRNYISIAHE